MHSCLTLAPSLPPHPYPPPFRPQPAACAAHHTFAFTLRSLAPRALNLPPTARASAATAIIFRPQPRTSSRIVRASCAALALSSPSPLFPLLQLQLELRLVAGREALRRALLAMVPQIDELQKKRELMKQQQQAQQRQQARP